MSKKNEKKTESCCVILTTILVETVEEINMKIKIVKEMGEIKSVKYLKDKRKKKNKRLHLVMIIISTKNG